MTTDPYALVKTLLSSNWIAANSDGLLPTFKGTDDLEEAVPVSRGRAVISVYAGRPATRRRIQHRYEYARWEAPVTVDVRTGGTLGVKPKKNGVRMSGEVKRILDGRAAPDSYWSIIEVDEAGTQQAEYATYYRTLLNVLVIRHGKV